VKVLYIRSSTVQQNTERQSQNSEGFDYILEDKCSGLIPLWERPNGKQLKKLIDSGDLKELTVHSIDRLGRSTLDVLNVWKELTERGIVINCRNPHIRNFNERGEPDMFSELMISILSTMATFEKNMIKERQMEGIKIAKAKGVYVGRSVNTKESPEKFLDKPKNKKIVEYLSSGYTQNEISKILNCSFSTINKVIRYKRVVYGPDAYENRTQ
jgi:DNA invertase Pin-like site-specific DNA recombinase